MNNKVELAIQKFDQILSLKATVEMEEKGLNHLVATLTDEEMKEYVIRTSSATVGTCPKMVMQDAYTLLSEATDKKSRTF